MFVVHARLIDTDFYLTSDGMATDIPDRAVRFHSLEAAQHEAERQRRDRNWGNDLAARWSGQDVVTPGT